MDAQAFVRFWTDPRTGEVVKEPFLHIEGYLPVRSSAGEFDVTSLVHLDADGPGVSSASWSSAPFPDGSGTVPLWVGDAQESVWSDIANCEPREPTGPEDGIVTLTPSGPVEAPLLLLDVVWGVSGCSFVSGELALVQLTEPEFTPAR